MKGQISLFDGNAPFMFDKPIRLIELFAGYGSQHLALSALGVPFESWKICEWAVKSIQAYKDLHFSNDNFDYSAQLSDSQIIDFLAEKGISANYNEPMTKQQIQRLQADKRRVIYNNIFATHNLVNIQQAKGIDLDIKDTDKFTYLLTYSFPCQDLSSAGKRKGMAKDGNTRSGMLWQVERLLKECNDSLPQMLLMENVPEVVGTKNIHFFAEWLSFLDSLGYTSKWAILNAKDFGIPQNRERCFCISIKGNNHYYYFPNKRKLTHTLANVLENKVSKEYYLSNKLIDFFLAYEKKQNEKGNTFKFAPRSTTSPYVRTITTREGYRLGDNYLYDEDEKD